VTICGCAYRYYDRKTGTEHLYGVGHMKMRHIRPNEGVQGVVTGVSTFGVGFGFPRDGFNLHAGHETEQRLDIYAEDAQIRLEWPSSDFSRVNLGSKFPKGGNERNSSEFREAK